MARSALYLVVFVSSTNYIIEYLLLKIFGDSREVL